MTKLRITVTKEILERSKNCGSDGDSCAIACAVSMVFPYAYVETYQILPFFNAGDQDYLTTIGLPVVAVNFIKNFDHSSPEERANMDEISFEINVPDSVIQKINIDELKPLLENHPTLAILS